MKFIGITGGVGAGKSLILDYLRGHYNCKVVLADDLAKELMEPGNGLYDRLREAFSHLPVWEEDGRLDRPAMARLVFNDPKRMQLLNSIVHPEVKKAVLKMVDEARKDGAFKYFFLEAALLIEDNYGKLCDEIWYIYTSEENRRRRLKESRGYSDERIGAMMAGQLTEEEFRAAAAFTIDNNGQPEDAFRQIAGRLEIYSQQRD